MRPTGLVLALFFIYAGQQARAECNVNVQAPAGAGVVGTVSANHAKVGNLTVGFGGPVYLQVKNTGDINATFGVMIRKKGASFTNAICLRYELNLGTGQSYWLESKYVGDDYPARDADVFGINEGATVELTVHKVPSRPLTVPAGLTLNQEVRELFTELVDTTNAFQLTLEKSNRPEALYYSQTAQAINVITGAGLTAEGVTVEEQKEFVNANVNTVKTLTEIFNTGLNVSTSLIPFINDARDYYELISGRDLITGEEIDTFGRVLTGVAIIAGNGNLYRKIADKLKDSFKAKSIIREAAPGISALTYTGSGSWKSAEGIIYRKKIEGRENSLRHILRHASPGATNASVFVGNQRQVPALIDQAWKKRGAAVPPEPGKIYDVFVVDMGSVVGTKGEKKIRLVMEAGSTNIVTAYPSN